MNKGNSEVCTIWSIVATTVVQLTVILLQVIFSDTVLSIELIIVVSMQHNYRRDMTMKNYKKIHLAISIKEIVHLMAMLIKEVIEVRETSNSVTNETNRIMAKKPSKTKLVEVNLVFLKKRHVRDVRVLLVDYVVFTYFIHLKKSKNIKE